MNATIRRINAEVSYQQAFAAILETHDIDAETVARTLGFEVPDGHKVTVDQDHEGGEVAVASSPHRR